MRRRNARAVGRSKKRSKLRTILAYFQLAFLLIGGVGLGMVGAAVYRVWKVLPQDYNINSYSPIEATKIISSDGVILGSVYQEENRTVIPFKDIPKNLINATIAVEDSRFYSHVGVDLRGIGRAVYRNIRGGKLTEGGSTITQQLARNIYLSQEKTVSRKLQEMVLAIKIERTFSKNQILELYLNQVYYGSRAWGVETAARTYFGKSVKQLSLAQCALLAGLPKGPSLFSPYVDKDRSIKRRNIVLEQMHHYGYITAQQRDDAEAESVRLIGQHSTRYRFKAPYFVDYVLKELKARYGEYGEELIYRGGLKVYTTLNYSMQEAAERAVQEGVDGAKYNGVTQGALVSLDPETGYIKAMVGGVDYGEKQVNLAVQGHPQPGSSFKICVYTAAVDLLGWGPHRSIPNRIPAILQSGSKPYIPKNYDRRQARGSYTMEYAVAHSVNIPAVYTAREVGISKVIEYARLLGIKTYLAPYPSLALGASGVPPIEMANAYGVIAAGGKRAEPMCILRIENSDGGIIANNEPVVKTVLSSQTTETMDSLFRAVMTNGGTGSHIRVDDARGKTGTTNDNTNVWFIGYIPHKLVTAVWAGNDPPRPMRSHTYGGTICGPIWKQYTEAALDIQKHWSSPAAAQPIAAKPDSSSSNSATDQPEQHRVTEHHPTPTTDSSATAEKPRDERIVRVRVCNDSGQLATSRCPSSHVEAFVSGFQPTAKCDRCGSNSTSTGDSSDTGGGGDTTGASGT
jgi:penicillin-binding protein 1A